MSDTQYFIQRGGSVKGPYSLSKLQSGLASGKLRDSDGVAANKSGPWQPLGRWIRNATASEDDDSDDDLMGQPYDDETYLDDLARLVQSAKPVVRQEATTSKVDIARPSLRQRIEESGVEVDWDVLLGNLKKLALILGGVAAVGLTIWFGIPLASRAVQDTIQQVNEFQEAVAQVEALQPAVEARNDNDKSGKKFTPRSGRPSKAILGRWRSQVDAPGMRFPKWDFELYVAPHEKGLLFTKVWAEGTIEEEVYVVDSENASKRSLTVTRLYSPNENREKREELDDDNSFILLGANGTLTYSRMVWEKPVMNDFDKATTRRVEEPYYVCKYVDDSQEP